MTSNNDNNDFEKEVTQKERRKLKAKREKGESIWEGFSVFGLIGWSIAVPTVLMGLLGLWLDERNPTERSYTLALLSAGLFVGCLNAWYWVSRKMKDIEEKPTDNEQNK